MEELGSKDVRNDKEAEFKKIEAEFKALETLLPAIKPEAYLKCLCKTYTGQACYQGINKSLASKKTNRVSKYLFTMLKKI